jgi:hypothetical protein
VAYNSAAVPGERGRSQNDGNIDLTRVILYVGETQILTSVGALPVVFEIEAKSLGEAAEKFADAAKVGVERTMRQLQELRREAASSIVVPDRMPPGLGGPGLGGPGGMRGGGGKIQLP